MATRPPTDAASIMQSYLDFGAAQTNNKLDEKMAEVSRASAQKREELDPFTVGAGIVTGKGVQSASPYEMDYRNLNPAQLMSRYGADEGLAMTTQRRQGIEAYLQPSYAPDRTTGQIVGDTLNTVATAPIQMLGSLGALEAGGLGQIARWTGNDNLARGYENEAQWLSDRTGSFVRSMQGGQSKQMQDARRAYATETSLDERDSAKLYAEDVKTDGSFLAGAKRIARDAVSGFRNANSLIVGDTIANAGGSLIGGGILSKTLKTIGRGIVKTGAVSGTGRIAALGSKAAMPTAIVAMESGAAYQQTFDAAMQDLADRTDLTDNQKREIANKAGLEAAAIQGGVTAVTAPLLGGAQFERAPFSVNSITDAFRRTAGETIEEGFQEGSAQIAQNKALQDQVDPNQTLSEGVGQNVGLGAIGGFGSSAGTQAPGIAMRTALETAKLPVRALSKALTFAGDRVSRDNEAYRDDLIRKADAAENYFNESPESFSGGDQILFDEKDPDVIETARMFNIPQSRIENALNDGIFRAQVEVTKRMKTVADTKAPIEERLDATTDLNGLRDDEALAQNVDSVDGLKGIKNVVAKAVQSPVVQNSLASARKLYSENAPKINARILSMLDEVRSKPQSETKQADLDASAAFTLSMAEQAPDKVDPTINDRIQFHADQGDITLSPQQRSTLRASSALVRGAQAIADQNKYQLPDANEVSRQILTKKWEREKEVVGDLRKKSLLEHMEGIRAAYNAGDLQLASDRLADLRFFAEHMSNKIGALNASFRAPGEDGRHLPVKYDALIRPRVFRQTQGDGLLVVPYRENSVRFAQQVAVEAGTVASVLNNLINAFPDAAQFGGVEHLVVPSLDPMLDGDAVTVAEDYRMNRRVVPRNVEDTTNGAANRALSETDQTGQMEPSSEDAPVVDTPVQEDADVIPDQRNSEAPETNDVIPLDQTVTPAEAHSDETGNVYTFRDLPAKVDKPVRAMLDRISDAMKGVLKDVPIYVAGDSTDGSFTASSTARVVYGVAGTGVIVLHDSFLNTIMNGEIGEDALMRILTHEMGHLIDARAGDENSLMSGAAIYDQSRRFYQVFKAVLNTSNRVEALYKPRFDYIESQKGWSFNAEFFAELASFVLLNPALAQELIPELYDEFLSHIGGQLGQIRVESATPDLVAATESDQQAAPAGSVEPATAEGSMADGQTDRLTDQASENNSSQDVREAGQNQPSATLLSGLLGSKTENRAKASLIEPKNTTSRTMDVTDPIATVRAAMRNENALKAAIGNSELNRAFSASVAKAYQQFLEIGQNLSEIMEERLQAYLADRGKRGVTPDQALSFLEAQSLNIMDAETGKYNPTLLENAVLAGLQWYLKINQFGSRMDEKDARQYLRLDQNAVLPEGLVDELNVGMTQAQTVRSLAREIGRFWGLNENPNTPRNYAEGVKEGVAKELLEAMMNLKLDGVSMIDQIKIDISGVTTNENINELNHYQPGDGFLEFDDAVREFPTAIEKAVLTEPEEINYIGTPPTDVVKTQLRNDAVENTERQNASTKVQQEVSHFLNEPFIEMLDVMGEDMVLRLFAGGDIENPDRALNVNHKKTLKGRNVTVQSAFRQILGLRAETKNVASRNGAAVGETPIFYAYNNTVVNRSQMLGKDNPQSNKLMREAVLPTWATLDLTDGNIRDLYMMGLAQALGIKVHTQDPETSIQQVTEKLSTQFPKTLEILNGTSPTRFTAEAIDAMKDEGVNSVVALHALMDWTRLQNSEDKSQHRTAIYFEADGVTNGVINAMALFSSDKFTGEQLEALQRGGYNVGEQPMSLGQIRKAFDAKAADLYGLAGTKTTQAIRALRAKYQGSREVTRQFDAVRDLLVEFIGDISYDGQNLIVDRGATKNPLTITIYGSGARGIAGNIVDEVVSKIYERMSEAAQHRLDDKTLTPAQAFYGGDAETAQVKFDRLMDAVNTLTKDQLVKDDIKGLFVQDARPPKRESAKDFVNFTFAPESIRALRENVLHAFVGPMVEGIEQTVGEDLMQSMNLIKTQVQAWSLIGKFAYQQAYERVMANKRRDNPKRSKNDLLSRAEEERVLQSVWSFLPYFSTGDQNFLFGMKQAMDVRSEFAQSLTQTLETRAFGYVPDDAGVAGIPGLTIGAGDGQTVINAMLDPRIKELSSGFMQIFDGIHSSVADMNLMSQISNQAVFDAWQKNPLENLSDAFAKMVSKLDLSKLDLNDEQRSALTKSLFPARFWNTKMTDELLTVRLNQWAKHGQEVSQKVGERHAVMSQIQSSVDQMAGASSPYLNEGLILSGSSSQKAAAMEQVRAEIRANLNNNQAQQREAATTPPASVQTSGQASAQTSVELMGKAIEKQITKITKDPTTRALLRDVVRSGRIEDYTIHTGTREELLVQAASMGIAIPADRAKTFMGFHVGDAKAVFVVDGNPETMLHELIHAATFETLDAHYRGEDVGTAAQLAISNLEELMQQFKDTDLQNDAQQNALDEMERQEAAGSRAGELNEFMAWSLANADLQASLKAQEAPVAVRMARKVVSAIKALLWGGKRSAAVKDDVFSNIRFNTNILMRSAMPTLSESNARTVLFHDPSFGDSPRINTLMERIKNKLTDYADTNEVERLLRRSEVTTQQVRAASVANNFEAAGFNMTPQERMAFLHMVAIMGTSADIDPNSTVRAQELFTHVGKHLGIEEFLRNPNEDDPADTAQATMKFNVLMGKLVGKKDSHDRSFVLPAFMALAATNNEFRAILNKMPMPKTQYAQWNSVDNILDNIGDSTIDNLSRWVSGEGVMSKDVQTAVDGLMGQMLQTNEEARLFIEKFTNPVGNGIDRANDIVRDAMDWVGKTTRNIANESKAKNPNAKVRNLLLESVATVGALLNEENGHEAATQFMSAANQRKVWTPLYDMLKDLIGRTAENAQVYDLIKIARTWVNGMRQQFREQLPRILNSKFSRTLTDQEQTHLHQGLGQTGLASLIRGNSVEQALNLLADEDARNAEILRLEDRISSRANGALVLQKAKQLADFMIFKKNDRPWLLANAEAIAHLLHQGVKNIDTSSEQIRDIDHLTTLYAVQNLSDATRASLSSLVQSEAKGMSFMLSYLQGQDEIDAAKAKGNARFNHFKGHMPADSQQGVSLIVASDENADKLLEKSYIRLGKYDGSSKDPTTKYMAYYFSPVSGRAPFAQGIMQNVQQTVSGVDLSTGFSTGLTAGQITDPQLVQRLAARNQEGGNTLIPRFDENGNLYAFERSVDPSVLSKLQPNTNMAKMMGVRSGRQSEEATAHQLNRALIDRLRDMWDVDKKANREAEYVNLYTSKDPIHQDAIKIFSNETKDYLMARFGSQQINVPGPNGKDITITVPHLMVRKDMIDDAIGYRQASIGDAWTGNSRWSPQTQEHVKKILMGMWGNKAYARAIKGEQLLQQFIQDVRVAIVIKSIVVPMANAANNIYQLIGRGVPIVNILREIPKKTAEIESWHKSRIRQIEAEAELHALGDTEPLQRRRLEAEIQTIKDSHKRLSIWPLLEAGEFSSISDAGSRDDILLTEGKLSEYLEKAVNKLPPSVRTAGKYAIISKDTALFRALQKSVEYGDFVAKAIMYDDLTKRQKRDRSYALGRVTEEFVNYDRLPGRDRAYLESIGLMWFWNFKIRSAKVALSMVRNNPIHSLIATSLPMPISGIGLPLDDNLWSALFDGRLTGSVGYHMAFRAPGLLPIGNLLG